MSRVGVARTREEVEPGTDAVEQRVGREELRAGGGELDRKRHPVEAFAELVHGGGVLEVGADGLCPRDEERCGLVGDEWRQVELDLGLDPKRLTARDEQSELLRCFGEGRDGARGVRQELFEVVEQDVRPLLSDTGRDRRGLCGVRAEGRGDRERYELRVAERRERDEDSAALGLLGE
jgi:hypothetical protein